MSREQGKRTGWFEWLTSKRVLGCALMMGVCCGVAAPRAHCQTRNVTFSMPYLECFQTTEAGEDEVYLVISGRWRSGNSFTFRLPNASGHWDLNDGEGDPPLLSQDLLNLPMREGDAVDFVVMVMEEDGGTVGGWARLAGGALGFIDEGAGALITFIGSLLDFQDSDDFIGAVSVHIEMRNGQPLMQIKPAERVSSNWDTDSYWSRLPVNMNGDGSSYVATFAVR